MNFFDEVMKLERQRTMNYAGDIPDSDEIQCPICGSVEWGFLLKDCHGDMVGCQDCVTKVYSPDL